MTEDETTKVYSYIYLILYGVDRFLFAFILIRMYQNKIKSKNKIHISETCNENINYTIEDMAEQSPV